MTISTEEMIRIASEAKIPKIMGMNRKRSVTIDTIPARAAIHVPRIDPEDDSLTVPAPRIETLTFHLEDQMFGGTTYVAITCQGRIIVLPFVWEGWDELAKSHIRVTH